MTNPEPPPRGVEYPPLEQTPPPVDPYAPVDYPAYSPGPDPGYGGALPPPVYPPQYGPPQGMPPQSGAYPAQPPGYPPQPPGFPPQPPGYPPQAPYGGYGYPGYGGDPYDPYRALKPPGTNGKAIAALVTSIAGLLFCGLPSIAGLILGVIAMRETKRTGQDGYGLALAGVIIGALVVVLFVLYIVVVAFLAASTSGYNDF